MVINTHLKYSEENAVDVDYLIGKRLRQRRIEIGITQQELAKRVNVSIQQLQKYEKAINRISGSRLYDFAVALRVPIEYFYSDNRHSINYVAEDGLPYEMDDTATNVLDEEIREVVQVFSRIKHPKLRKNITDLLKNISLNLQD